MTRGTVLRNERRADAPTPRPAASRFLTQLVEAATRLVKAGGRTPLTLAALGLVLVVGLAYRFFCDAPVVYRLAALLIILALIMTLAFLAFRNQPDVPHESTFRNRADELLPTTEDDPAIRANDSASPSGRVHARSQASLATPVPPVDVHSQGTVQLTMRALRLTDLTEYKLQAGCGTPYVTKGPLDASSDLYISRNCDLTLHSAIRDSVTGIFAIRGDYETGKTSLLFRTEATFRSTHRTVFIDLSGLRCDSISDFATGFLEKLGDELQSMRSRDWADIQDRISQCGPSLLLLDEFGALKEHHLLAYVCQQLHSMRVRDGSKLVVVVASPVPIQVLVEHEGIHPKYLRELREVEIDKVSPKQCVELAKFLPVQMQTTVRTHVKAVLDLSNGNARELQCVFSRLFEMSSPDVKVQDIVQTLYDKTNYS